jgi:hypothetical protein
MVGNRVLCAALSTLILSMIATHQAAGWSSGGHRIVADIAYDLLTPEERGKIVTLIRDNHKGFNKHFKAHLKTELPNANADDEARWIFLQAAIWPDMIPRNPWHFVNFPLFLSETDEMALKDDIKPNLKSTLPKGFNEKKDANKLNCMQAVKYCIREIKDAHTEAHKVPEFYCWLIHVVGDIHQPLHSTSLVSRARFNQSEGDKGGNGISVKPGSSLHSYWDGLHGKNQGKKFQPLSDIRKRSATILANKDNVDAAELAKKKLNPLDWVKESHEYAKSDVYTQKIKDAVAEGEADPKADLKEVVLDKAYQKRAHEIADRRVAEAGYRLAALLKQLD